MVKELYAKLQSGVPIEKLMIEHSEDPGSQEGRGYRIELGDSMARMFRALSLRWLRAGSIDMIAGPDLVSSALEPHEFLDFVGGRLVDRVPHRRFPARLRRFWDGVRGWPDVPAIRRAPRASGGLARQSRDGPALVRRAVFWSWNTFYLNRKLYTVQITNISH